jgi:hypothetical protein
VHWHARIAARRPGLPVHLNQGRHQRPSGHPGNDFYPQKPGALDFGKTTFGVLLSAESAAAGDVEVMGSWAVTAT